MRFIHSGFQVIKTSPLGFFFGASYKFMDYLWMFNSKISTVDTDYASMVAQMIIAGFGGSVVGNAYQKAQQAYTPIDDSPNRFFQFLNFAYDNSKGIIIGVLYETFDWLWVMANKDNLVDDADRWAMTVQMFIAGGFGSLLNVIYDRIGILFTPRNGTEMQNYNSLTMPQTDDGYNNTTSIR